jgi:sulfoxide reductase heme-binding subunit YedZ
MPTRWQACTRAWTCAATSDPVASAIDRRYRYAYKPALFAACLVPLAWAIGGIFALPVPGLGADPVRKVLGIFGHSALNLLLATLAITPLRQLSGNAHLLRLRRMLGVFSFSYALLHFLVYLGPYQSFMWGMIVHDLMKRPYITIGFAALLLLLPLAITSTNGMMRRLKRRWQSLHRLVYPIAVLGVWHYWWGVKMDYLEPLVYALLLALLLGWRLRRRLRAATSRSAPPTVPGTA